ncbi:MAG: glycosyltransferase [Acetanaerobacterium sp.]
MANQYNICVYAICKNEEEFVDRWMDSMREADQIVVTDTGSTDGTVERLRARGAVVLVEEIKPWRFDVARNRSLENVPEDVDICVCTDLDEVFEPGWRARLETVWTPQSTMGRYRYNWSLKADGTPDVHFSYFKVHTRKNYAWIYPVHECLRYVGEGTSNEIFIDGMVLNHYPDQTKSRGSYLPLLELGVRETPEDGRMNFYLGREYFFGARWQDCIATLQRYLMLKRVTWEDERCAAMRLIARSYNYLGDRVQSRRWFLRAVAECVQMREPYVEFTQAAYEWQDWILCLCMAEHAIAITEKSRTYISVGYAWDYTPHDLAGIASYRLGLYERSLAHARNALDLAPQDARLQNNLKCIEKRAKGIADK